MCDSAGSCWTPRFSAVFRTPWGFSQCVPSHLWGHGGPQHLFQLLSACLPVPRSPDGEKPRCPPALRLWLERELGRRPQRAEAPSCSSDCKEAADKEGHGQDRAPRQERLRSHTGLPGVARTSRQCRQPASRSSFARSEGEGTQHPVSVPRLEQGQPALPAATCAKVDSRSHLAVAEVALPLGAGLTLHFARYSWRPCSIFQPF